MTITRAGHPLRGRRLRVDRSGGARRNDGKVIVLLPDGSPALIPTDWTDLHLHTHAVSLDNGSKTVLLNLTGLRRLVRLVDAMSVGGSQEGAS